MSHGKFYNKIYSSMVEPGGYNVTLEKRFQGKGRTGRYLVLYFSSHEHSFKLSLFYSRFKKPIGGGLDFNKIPLGSPLWLEIGLTAKGYPKIIDAERGWRHHAAGPKVWSNDSFLADSFSPALTTHYERISTIQQE